jgi:phage tail sheath protein FI
MAYKTPGVYVEEITTLAPSVVAVETAIPAFIGYTETAVDDSGTNLKLVPTRIKSLLEYQRFFGGDFVPATYQVVVDTAAGNAVGAVTPQNGAGTERRYRLFNSVRHYYANGGGPCYIVSVGSYADAPALGTSTTGLLGGLASVAPVDDPTLLVFPDGVSLSVANMGALQVAALAQCELLQDRFVIMDLCQGDQLASLTIDPIANFRQNVGTNSLKYGATYYPWVRTIYAPPVHFRQLSLVNTASPPVPLPDTAPPPFPNNSIDGLTADPVLNALVPAVRSADSTVAAIVSAVNVSGMTGPGALALNRANFADLSTHFDGLLAQLRQLPGTASDADVRQRFGNLLLLPRAISLGLRTFDTQSVTGITRSGATATATTASPHGFSTGQRVTIAGANQAEYNGTFTITVTGGTTFTYAVTGAPATPATGTITAGPALPATLTLAANELRADSTVTGAVSGLIAFEKNTAVMASVSATRTPTDVATDYASLDGSDWIKPAANAGAIPANTDPIPGANAREKALNAATSVRRFVDPLAAAMLSVFSAAEFLASEAENQLFARHPVFSDIVSQVTRTMELLPPSGAVAGVYAAVDRTRGVWKAPANVSLADVSGVAVKVNDQIQEDLNVTSTGKSVNAIRVFAGKGCLVWGARTLAGNDNEWRYVPVRRFFNMAEESIKKATEPFVFEPNDRGTWVRVRAMIENFLTVQWRQGALAGSVPAQAFFVKVGLGETMTSQDILEGRMIVEVGMAVVRPAEFIVLRFAHKMQTS